jgi:hypothetical protein
MKQIMWIASLGLVALLLAPVASQADVMELTPTQAAVLPAEESGMSRVVLAYDLSGLRSGEGRRIEEALLDWIVVGVPSDEPSEYVAYPVTAAWTAEGAASNGSVTRAEEAAARWEITPMDYERNGKGFLRLDLTRLVADWAAGRATNHGIVVVTPSVSREAFASQLPGARLTVRHGFIQD